MAMQDSPAWILRCAQNDRMRLLNRATSLMWDSRGHRPPLQLLPHDSLALSFRVGGEGFKHFCADRIGDEPAARRELHPAFG